MLFIYLIFSLFSLSLSTSLSLLPPLPSFFLSISFTLHFLSLSISFSHTLCVSLPLLIYNLFISALFLVLVVCFLLLSLFSLFPLLPSRLLSFLLFLLLFFLLVLLPFLLVFPFFSFRFLFLYISHSLFPSLSRLSPFGSLSPSLSPTLLFSIYLVFFSFLLLFLYHLLLLILLLFCLIFLLLFFFFICFLIFFPPPPFSLSFYHRLSHHSYKYFPYSSCSVLFSKHNLCVPFLFLDFLTLHSIYHSHKQCVFRYNLHRYAFHSNSLVLHLSNYHPA